MFKGDWKEYYVIRVKLLFLILSVHVLKLLLTEKSKVISLLLVVKKLTHAFIYSFLSKYLVAYSVTGAILR